MLDRDATTKYFNLLGGRYERSGNKVQIYYMSLSDLLYDVPEAKIDYSALDEKTRLQVQSAHDEIRNFARNVEKEGEFRNAIEDRLEKEMSLKVQDFFKFSDICEKFYREHPEIPANEVIIKIEDTNVILLTKEEVGDE